MLKKMLEISFPRVEICFDFGGLPAFVIILSVSYLMPEVTECRAGPGNRAVNSYSNALDVATLENWFTHASIFKGLREDRVNALNKIWGYA